MDDYDYEPDEAQLAELLRRWDKPDPIAALERGGTAVHEAAHAVAAAICGVQWTSARLLDRPVMLGYRAWVRIPVIDSDADKAFIYWVGCWAEARWLGIPLEEAQRTSGGIDNRVVGAYWTAGGREGPDRWVAAMEPAWSEVLSFARKLANHGVVFAGGSACLVEHDLAALI